MRASFPEFSLWARDSDYHVYGSSAHGSADYRQAPAYQRPAILLMGSERQGLADEQASVCERMIRLPMRGEVTSLNLAVATGVLLYGMLGKMDRER